MATAASTTTTAAGSMDTMAWISSKRELVAAKITKIRAKLPLPADVAVATAGGCVQVRGNEREEKRMDRRKNEWWWRRRRRMWMRVCVRERETSACSV